MATNAPAPVNPELVIRKLSESTTIFSCPFARGGLVPFGGRSTAIKLQDGNVWLIASHPLDPDTLTTLNNLGPTKFIVSPDREHNIFLQQYINAYPEAQVFVPLGVKENWQKKGQTSLINRITFTFGQGKGDPFPALTNGEILSADFGKAHGNEDVSRFMSISELEPHAETRFFSRGMQIAFLHVPSKTLIQADLLFNLPPDEQYSKSSKKSTAFLASNLLRPGTTGHKRLAWYLMGKDKKVMAQQAKVISAWDFDRMIPCHGNVMESGAKAAWNSTYDWYINGKK
ncbi:BQ2448_3982 [Microbotryum intermedium]|uniref:BQ2448_3982 protein n=1 Tax=Microbotryum intermedium TaxID=269621 RepID=A0A238FGY7_9BASI|nr:BQ2448_3982 [Microbotryum intermedium]